MGAWHVREGRRGLPQPAVSHNHARIMIAIQ